MAILSDDLIHLDASYRAYAGLSAPERIDWIRQERWIHYARAEQVLARLADLLTYPPRDRMPCLLLFGATGMGKTRIVQKSFAITVQVLTDGLGAPVCRWPVSRCHPPQASGICTKNS